jgi:hypothetical protein
MSENDIDNLTKNLALTSLDDSKEVKLGNKEIITKIIDIINNDFDHKMTPDKYNLADIFIRPKNVNGDWLRIAVRYSSFNNIIAHSSNEKIPSYVLVYLTNTDRTWIICNKEITVKRVQIKLNMKNKYDIFEVKQKDIVKKIKKHYETCELVEDTDDTKYTIIEYNTEHLIYVTYDFDEIVKRFAERNCCVLTTQDEFTTEKMTTKTKMRVTMSCDHEDTLSLYAFQKRGNSVCQQCIYAEVTKNNYNEIERIATGNLNEATSFEYIKNILKNDFDVQKTHEGCKCDMIMKPLIISDDKWLGIQLKTMTCTKTITQYGFKKIGKYPNIVIICIAMPTNKIWVFDGNDLLGKTGISIGKNESKYNKNEILKDNLVNLIKTKYDIYHKYSLEDLNIPSGTNQQKEHTNRLFRENLLDNQFILEYPIIDGTKYDIIINKFKVQDKCAIKVKNVNSYYVNLKAVTNYKLGDNDYYWINMPDSNFYVIPEALLLDDNDNIVIRITLNKVYEKYYFEYEDPNIIQKLKKIFL